ncbi:ABC transporter permease [candidate division CSSED10-310 bacterium]|uniref:ABC transporter permease n=1 Tax=candidate division CSSED10-310 bacterium TaxID=2855610 RepID=A0ABV6YY59_UNCC1
MVVRDLWVIFVKELLCFVRDRNIVIYSILLPLFLYPTTFWVMNQIIMFQRGSVENKVSRVGLVNADFSAEFCELLAREEMIETVAAPLDIGDGGVDAILEIEDFSYDEKNPCFAFLIRFEQADEYSVLAQTRLMAVIDQFRAFMLDYIIVTNEFPLELSQSFTIETKNIASDKQMGAFIIARILPMLIIIMAAMGTLYPAIDVIVGERERQTMETNLLVPTSRLILIGGKFAAVTLAGVVAVLLNIGSLAITASHTLFLLEDQGSAIFTIPARAYPLIVLTTIIIAAGFGAACILIASYARTFREGQSFVTPFFIISFQPAVIASLPGISLTYLVSIIPVANAAVMFREIITGIYHWEKILIVLGTLLIYTLLLLVITARRINNENTLWREKAEHIKQTMKKRRWFKLWSVLRRK